jgi:hypothetical protein
MALNALSADDRMRYARQVALDEIGVAGQARLRGARVRVSLRAELGYAASSTEAQSSEAQSSEVAALYLERAGVHVQRAAASGPAQEAPPDAVIADHSKAVLGAHAGDPRLEHAAAWLLGSFDAVETIKVILGVGVAARLPEGLVLAGALAEQSQLAEQKP